MAGKYNSKRYRVDEKSVDNPSPPPAKLVRYVIYDRRAGVEIDKFYGRREDADNECDHLNSLDASP